MIDWQKAYYILEVAAMANDYGPSLHWLRNEAVEALEEMHESPAKPPMGKPVDVPSQPMKGPR
jgi:hypothetical protein